MSSKASWNAYRHSTSFVRSHTDKNCIWIHADSSRITWEIEKKAEKKLQNYNQKKPCTLMRTRLIYNRKIPDKMDRIPRSAATSKKEECRWCGKEVLPYALIRSEALRKRVKKSVRLNTQNTNHIKQTSAHIKRALLRARRLKSSKLKLHTMRIIIKIPEMSPIFL